MRSEQRHQDTTVHREHSLLMHDFYTMDFRFRHVGIAVPDLDGAIQFFESVIGHKLVSGPFEDPIQQAKIAFVGTGADYTELVAPLHASSHVQKLVDRGAGAYHICYEVDDLSAATHVLREARCVVMSEPAPAVAFGGRHIAWFYTPMKTLIELLDSPKLKP